MLRRAAPALCVLALALTGCGAERASLPSFGLPEDAEFERTRFARAGLTLDLPVGMAVQRRRPPGVFRATRADWYVAAFAYRRKEQLPRTRRELSTARRRLVRQVRRRDRRYRLVRARDARVGGARAVELLGDQRVSGARLRIRSLHVFRRSAEYVVEMAAPAAQFAGLNRVIFRRVARSVRVTGRIRRARR